MRIGRVLQSLGFSSYAALCTFLHCGHFRLWMRGLEGKRVMDILGIL